MRAFLRYSVLLLVGVVLIVSVVLVYLSIDGKAGNVARQQVSNSGTTLAAASKTAVDNTPITPELTATPKPPCKSKQRSFQMGIAYPDWGTTSYGPSDTKWLSDLPVMQAETSACWVEMPVLLHQSSLTSTVVTQGPATAQLSSFDYGVRFAHSLGLHVFVTIQLQVAGSQPWSGAITLWSYSQQQQWFMSYWQAIKPYVETVAQDNVEQFALGTEYAWLEQNAATSLWNGLIDEVSQVFPGTLTYDMNWGSLQTPPPSWMRNPHLKMIGISAYSPLVNTPERVDPQLIPNLWKQTVKPQLDNFSRKLGEPIFLSEVGFPNGKYALYRPWQSADNGGPDPVEQAAACGAVLKDIIPDQNILGSFFWGWDNTEDFNLYAVQATTVIQSYYKALQA
jgi:Glycoside Hydrolase Family 113